MYASAINAGRLLAGCVAAILLAGRVLAVDGAVAGPPTDPGRHPEIPHAHDEETTQKLRDAIPAFQGIPDPALHAIMSGMRADYAWYISPAGTPGRVGVLILNHGVGEESDRAFREAVDPVARRQPTAIAFGMAMTTSEALQQAVDDLNATGVRTIVAVDPESSAHKSLYRQWGYILGLRPRAAYVAVPPVKSKAKLLLAEPMNHDPLIAGILLDHARAISTDPPKEAVIIIAHGPEDNEDNPPDLAEVQLLADWVQKKSRFASVQALNIQDDAPPPVRAANVKAFRGLVTDAQARGLQVLVVPYVINTKGLQPKLQKDLEGLSFRFQDQGISGHPNFLKWMDQAVQWALEAG